MKKMFWISLAGGIICLVIYGLAVAITFAQIANRGIIGGADMPTLAYAASRWYWIAGIALVMIIEALVMRIIHHVKEQKK